MKHHLLIYFFACLICWISGCAPRTLDLTGKSLEEIEQKICGRKNVRFLAIGPEGLTIYPPFNILPQGSMPDSIPDCLGKLKGLESLHMMGYGLQRIPQEVFGFEQLRTLNLMGNPSLDVSPYVDDLVAIQSLDTLIIAFCHIDSAALHALRSKRPDLLIHTTEDMNLPGSK